MALTYHNINTAQRMNKAAQEYMATCTEETVGLNELMPLFVEKGIFKNNRNKSTMAIQTIHLLEKENRLDLMPNLNFKQRAKNKLWYFVKVEK